MSIQPNTFAAACYEQNSIAELNEALARQTADQTDCETWGMTPDEWRAEIELALRERLAA